MIGGGRKGEYGKVAHAGEWREQANHGNSKLRLRSEVEGPEKEGSVEDSG